MILETTIQNELNELVDQVVYIQIIGSFAPNVDYSQTKEIVTSTHSFIKTASVEEIKRKLPELKYTLTNMTSLIMNKYPLKRELRSVTTEFNNFFKNGSDVYSNGLEFGWLDKQIDLSQLNLYKDIPYHFRIGLAAHKGNGSIEEDFLLKDAFNILVKAEYYKKLLLDYGEKLKNSEKLKGKKEFTQTLYEQITDIKFEVAAHCRLAIISFYAFVEAFVNSVGYSYLLQNFYSLSEENKELLNGFKKGRFLQLKSKIEKFQTLIRSDKKAKIIVSDDKQIPQDFKHFFDYYEQLRNAAMHYSPTKERIWMKPEEWLDKAIGFGKLSTNISLEFWKACYPNSDGPEYLGKLDYDLHLNNAIKRQEKIQQIDADRGNFAYD